MKRTFLVPVLGALLLALATPACAQATWRDSRGGYGSADARRVAFERGFREGVIEGERDGRSRDVFRYQDERDFQRADIGYSRSYGDLERYRVHFRSGFADGYAEGYRRHARGSYGRDDGRYGGGYGYSQGREASLSPFEIGAREGYEKGREEAGRRGRGDARSHKWYREGDRHYESRYGNRDRYKNEYRRGFLAGYEQAYRGRR